MPWLRSASLLATLLTIGLPGGARAQAYDTETYSRSVAAMRPSFTLSAGALHHDLSRNGPAPMLAARGELPLSAHLLVEGGLGAARVGQRFRGLTTFVAPEAQIQAQMPIAGMWVAPYIGAGVGAALERPVGALAPTRRDLAVSAAAGVRYWLTEQRGLRAELRLRGVRSGLTGSTAEYTLGSSWRL